jgi:hypothetical protein
MTIRRADPQLIVDAMEYVEAVHVDLTAENTAPAPGVLGRVVTAILADPALSNYVRTWAEERRTRQARASWRPRPPMDANYRRVCELLRRAGDERR